MRHYFLILFFLVTACEYGEKNPLQNSDYVNQIKNLNAETAYIGMSECALCHPDIYSTFQHTGKGRSFHIPNKETAVEDYSNVHVYDKHFDFHYTAFWKNNDMFICEYRLKNSDTIYKRIEKVDYVIGSGNQTVSYIRERNGYLFEMPLTWYVNKKIWDLSPGYENGKSSRFERPIANLCMSCHNSDFQFVQHSSNKFDRVGEGVSCERCHGAGEIHKFAALNQKTIEGTIVNPAKLPTALRFDICRQCHLEGVIVQKDGKDFSHFRPGQALNTFVDIFIPVVENEKEFGFASHVERLQMSNCFKKSNDKMDCTTCHNPHQPIQSNSVEYFNEKCMLCHSTNDCGESHTKVMSKNNSCVECHMAKGGTKDIPHVSSTDHLIRVLKDEEKNLPVHQKSAKKTFQSFTSLKVDERTQVLLRMNYYEQFEPEILYLKEVSHLTKFLSDEEKLRYAYLSKTNPDVDLSSVDFNVKNPFSAFYMYNFLTEPLLKEKWINKAVEMAPFKIDFLYEAATFYHEKENFEKAKQFYERLLSLNPEHHKAQSNFGFLLMTEGKTKEAVECFKKSLSIAPDYMLARENLAQAYLLLNDKNKAGEHLKILLESNPQNEKYKQLLKSL